MRKGKGEFETKKSLVQFKNGPLVESEDEKPQKKPSAALAEMEEVAHRASTKGSLGITIILQSYSVLLFITKG